MPRGDRTGPAGMGPRTGRAMGFCSGFNAPGYMNAMPGRGFGFGRGFGRGRGFRRMQPVMSQEAWYPVPAMPPAKEEIAELKAEKDFLEEDLKAIDARLKQLEKKK